MFIKKLRIKKLLSAHLSTALLTSLSVTLLATGLQSPAVAQTASNQADSLQTDSLSIVDDEAVELAQLRRRRRTRAAQQLNYVGVGADFGTVDDTSFAVISKLSLTDNISVRPAALIGDDFSVLVPVTYDFTQLSAGTENLQIRPYVGAGGSYISSDDDDEELGLLVSAGIDVPVSRRFVVNAQANYAGVFSDEENFGLTVGIGYSIGR